MNAVLSPELLHPGAFFVLEQSGLLIRDGEFLYQHSRWANAIVLAVFSMEELGKSSMVLEKMRAALRGQPVTLDDLPNCYRNHRHKLTDGRGSDTILPLQVCGGTIQDAVRQRWEELIVLGEAEREAETHEKRMNALYVNLGG